MGMGVDGEDPWSREYMTHGDDGRRSESERLFHRTSPGRFSAAAVSLVNTSNPAFRSTGSQSCCEEPNSAHSLNSGSPTRQIPVRPLSQPNFSFTHRTFDYNLFDVYCQ